MRSNISPPPSTDQDQLTPFQRFLSSRLVTSTGMLLSKHAPLPLGYAVADLIAGLISRFKLDVYQIVYRNLRQVVSPDVDAEKLHQLVRQVFRNTARNYYDLWHLVSRGPEAICQAVHFPPDAWANIKQALERGKGTIMVCPHAGNFDLGVLALAARGMDIQILGLASPPTGGFDLMDHLRTQGGTRLTTISIQALREAIDRLRRGGIVATGIDRPVSNSEPTIDFFGRPAPLPTGHIRLALKTDAAVLVAGPHRHPETGHRVNISPPLEMIRTGDRDEEQHINLRRVTDWLETFIQIRPEQWAMFVPVWPTRHP